MSLILLRMIFSCGMISTRYYFICILVLITLKMVTWVAEICRWLRCNKNYVHSQIQVHFLVLLKKFVRLI